MLEELRRWAKNGGILIGTSAGTMLMAPTIATALVHGAQVTQFNL
jgi:peptidase E